jgi:coproporphyrinogen III oxidase-like Fe-S oxidoreductase
MHGSELARQTDAMESYFELVVDRLTSAGYRWYETANFCRTAERAAGRDLRARHNLAYWLGRDYLGLGVGAVSTVDGRRWRNTPRLPAYTNALSEGARPPRELEPLSADVRRRERVMLGLRLDEPLRLTGLTASLDDDALARLEWLGLVQSASDSAGAPTLALTTRGRMLGGGVTADLLA